MSRKSLVGKRVGLLTVTCLAGLTKSGQKLWNCDCECGNKHVVRIDFLNKGRIKSCGCLHKKAVTKHGHADSQKNGRRTTPSPTYSSWRSMLSRCNNSNATSYQYYGGRGITVCERWLHSFENFLADMGPRPDGMTLDRENTNGSYAADNCRWSTPKQQANNRRLRRAA